MAQAVETASDLAEGLTQLLMRQHNAVNLGETLYLGEIKALAFLSQTVRALARSATDTLRQQEANQ
ncbi:hypothetical protein PCH70_35620 [Pseudomonas cichorii JBC1]|nr:hypothetical protein PCH70_35620 [Pseudomonas cichorii JBC1]